jgi:hypothetical protein
MLEGTFQLIFLTVFAPQMRLVFVLKRQKYSQRLSFKINDWHEAWPWKWSHVLKNKIEYILCIGILGQKIDLFLMCRIWKYQLLVTNVAVEHT